MRPLKDAINDVDSQLKSVFHPEVCTLQRVKIDSRSSTPGRLCWHTAYFAPLSEPQLETTHRVRSLGALDLGYMRDLGLRDEDETIAMVWETAFYNQDAGCDPNFPFDDNDSYWTKLPPFCPLTTMMMPEGSTKPRKVPGCFSKSLVESEVKFALETSHPFVRGFKKRYRGAKGEKLLEYIMIQFEEYENSEHPAAGFQRVLTK